MRIERLTPTRTTCGTLYCPRCCWKLGRAESPSIGYLVRCGGCHRGLRVVDVEGGAVALIVDNDPRDDDCAFVAVD